MNERSISGGVAHDRLEEHIGPAGSEDQADDSDIHSSRSASEDDQHPHHPEQN